jgi:hypothetical protein
VKDENDGGQDKHTQSITRIVKQDDPKDLQKDFILSPLCFIETLLMVVSMSHVRQLT